MKTPTAIGAAMLADNLLGPDHTPSIAKFTIPTLVIDSSGSPELEEQKATAEKLPQSRFEAVQNAGHAVFIDQPETFNMLLRAFIAHCSHWPIQPTS